MFLYQKGGQYGSCFQATAPFLIKMYVGGLKVESTPAQCESQTTYCIAMVAFSILLAMSTCIQAGGQDPAFYKANPMASLFVFPICYLPFTSSVKTLSG